MTDKYDEKAQAFWKWFQLAPHAECKDGACAAKLATLLRTVAEEAVRSALTAVASAPDVSASNAYAAARAGWGAASLERGDHRKGGG